MGQARLQVCRRPGWQSDGTDIRADAVHDFRAAGIQAYPAPSNDTQIRIEAVDGVLNRMVDGYPSVAISPNCTVLISGFEGGYQYKRQYHMGNERQKNGRRRTGSPIFTMLSNMHS